MQPLDSHLLYTPCDPQSLPADLETPESLADATDTFDASIGQDRALEAVDFGIAIEQPGFNIFALGPPGLGKSTTVLAAVRAAAKLAKQPPDWCYVHNFAQPHRPNALELPAGRGRQFADDMRELIEDLEGAAPAVFDNEDTHARLQEIEEEFQERRTHALDELKKEGETKEIAVIETPTGFTFAPTGRGRTIVTPDVYERLTEAEKEEIQEAISGLKDDLQKLVRQFQIWRKEARDKVKSLYRELAELAVGTQVTALLERYTDLPGVREHLETMRTDLVNNIDDFLPREDTPMAALERAVNPLERYKVNLLVSHDEANGAPVVFEDTPNHGNLVGRVEHRAHMGTLITDFSLIKPGALHRANGGFLVLDARRILLQPFAWETLKATLRAREIKIESLERAFSMTTPVTLEPEPIPLDVKVVLIGDRQLYYLLGLYDPEMRELFKVAADFDSVMERGPATEAAYARQIARLGQAHELRPLDRDAIARMVEQGSRLAGDAHKLSAHLGDLSDLLVEANHHAGQAGRKRVTRKDVQKAIDAQIRRADRVPTLIQDSIAERTLLIDTDGEAVAQINGLSVIQLGERHFGHPMRVTATARVGKGEVVDIERQIELGGPIHSKGVLILSNYLMSRYGELRPISVTASLVFEQSYGGVEGDSASLAELCALLSALSGLPIKQSLAMTGSVNQLGRAQAIGGVNEKIEGFFDVCKRRGLNGEQGVVIPSANVAHLMLRDDVVEACKAGKFTIHAVGSIDEAISLMTGVAAGEPDDRMRFPPDTVNGKVQARVDELAEARRAFAESSRTNDGAASDNA